MIGGSIGQRIEDEDRIREIFETGTKKEVELLLDFEEDPEVSDEQRRLIAKVRKLLEAKGTFIARDRVVGSGNYKTERTPNLNETELDSQD